MLGEICTFKYGKALPESSRNGGAIPVFGSNGVVGFHDSAITVGQTIVIGRKGSFGEVNYSSGRSWPIDTAYFVDESATSQDIRWLYHRLGALGLNEMNKAAAVPGLNREDAYRKQLLVPPLPEQRRIAAILDQADALRARRREALAQLDRLTQAIFVEMFGDPVSNPKGWPTASLTELCHCYSGGTPSKANDDFWRGSLPWFSAKDMKAEDLFDSADHISEAVPKTSTLKLLPPDTVAIVVRGMILAHTFPVCVLRVPATINQDLKALIPIKPINSQFLAACLRVQAAFVLEQVSEAGHGTKRLDGQGLQKIRVLRPGQDLENTFDERVGAIEALKASHRAALTDLDALFTALQHRAFRGEL